MANRYWVGGTDNWNATAGTKWALTSGGAGGQAVPTSSDDVFFDASSGSGTVTVTSTANCKNLDFSGFTGTFSGSTAFLRVYGSVFTLGSGMTWTFSYEVLFQNGGTITSNGKTLTCSATFGGNWTLADNLVIRDIVNLTYGTFNANNKNFTCGALVSSNPNTRTITMGSGTWTVTAFSNTTIYLVDYGDLTINAGTSTVVVEPSANVGTLSIDFGEKTMNNVTLKDYVGNMQVYGSNNFSLLEIQPGASVYFEGGKTQTVTSFNATGAAGNGIVLAPISGSWTISCNAGNPTVEYCTISNSTATGGATWNAVNSTDSGGNTGWTFSTSIPTGNFLSLLI